jgi:uncharacterized protein YdeI (YjbR/CyaY-like superfamily)
MQLTKTVEEFIQKQEKLEEPLKKFREIMLATELEETIKWGAPVYMLKGKHVAGMGAFKSYVGIWFFQGTFLKDPNKKLVNAQEDKTKALRQLRFSSVDEVDYELAKEFVAEAIQNQKDGLETKPDLNKPLIIPNKLKEKLEADEDLKNSFDELTVSKRKEYSEYVSEGKREETKYKRLEKIIPMIRQKIELNDKYRK